MDAEFAGTHGQPALLTEPDCRDSGGSKKTARGIEAGVRGGEGKEQDTLSHVQSVGKKKRRKKGKK